MSNPTLSVTITSYNYGKYIEKTIKSVLNQTFSDFEIIIIDDASSDDSVQIIKRYVPLDSRILLIVHQENKGIVPSLIEACQLARGTYHVHIDSDDWIADPQAFELQLSVLNENPEMSFVYSIIATYNNQGEPRLIRKIYESDRILPGEKAVEKIITDRVAHTGFMMRMRAYRSCGGYSERYHYAHDFKLWTDLCNEGSVGYINRLLYIIREHESNATKSLQPLKYEEPIKIIEELFNGSLAQKMANPALVRHRALGANLTAYATPLIFSGFYRKGWRELYQQIRSRPRETLLQRHTAILMMRTVLGRKGYQVLENIHTRVARHKL